MSTRDDARRANTVAFYADLRRRNARHEYTAPSPEPKPRPPTSWDPDLYAKAKELGIRLPMSEADDV